MTDPINHPPYYTAVQAMNRQNAIDAACRNALKARQQSFDPVLGLAAALEEIERERTAPRPGGGLLFTYRDVIARLESMASPCAWWEKP